MPRIEGKAYILLWLLAPMVLGLAYSVFEGDPTVLQVVKSGIIILVLFFSVVIHEMSHGVAAGLCGDPTAERSGRLTFNPISHISLVGTIIVPLVLYYVNPQAVLGWAKPVPFNPNNLRRYPRDQVFLTVAGPLSNFSLAVISFGLYLVAALVFSRLNPEFPIPFTLNAPAIEPLPGVPFGIFWFVLFDIFAWGVLLNLLLGVFNLIPLPPLDGHWLLRAVLPSRFDHFFNKIGPFGFVILILAIQFDLLTYFFYPVYAAVFVFQLLAEMVLGL